MPDIADILVVTYGLKQAPSPEQIEQWASIAESLMKSGLDRDQAGKDAAKKTFPELFA